MFEDCTLTLIEPEEEEEGGKLVKPIAQFLCFIPDAVINLLQNMFITPENIKVDEDSYSIKYSPGIMFSGQVPAFDVNFFHPDDREIEIEVKDTEKSREELAQGQIISDVAEEAAGKILKKLKYQEGSSEYDTKKQEIIKLIKKKKKDVATNKESNDWKADFSYEEIKLEITYDWSSSIFYVYETEAQSQTTSTKTFRSTAKVLQSNIATWYNALRRIALVGLLSALIYIGIRIVLTSTSAKDKAKYKSMLKDWLIAMCILFTLHYIMSITITLVENINEVLKTSTMAANGEDVMMTAIRNDIADAKTWSSVIVQVVLYFVLMIFTIIFTIQYLRRVIYIAFLTMIAPLITLTYPLDKIKDSKSQAFDMWIKDYVFFMLIQVVHLLIYYIIVGSSLDLVEQENWVFAIVAIGFLVPAEKIVKKMFGFEKSKTLGAMAAGATGALIMNAINKIARESRR